MRERAHCGWDTVTQLKLKCGLELIPPKQFWAPREGKGCGDRSAVASSLDISYDEGTFAGF